MQKTDLPVQDLVAMVQRGELRLPEMQRGYVWRATRVRDLLDSLYRDYPSGNILVWETDEATPQREMAVGQSASPYAGRKLLLDGQQRITSLSAVLRGEPVHVRGRNKPVDILFNLDHPDNLQEVLEVDDDDDNDPDGVDDDEESEESLEERIQRQTFVVGARRIAALSNWVSVTEVFKSNSDEPFLAKAGVESLKDPNYSRYSKRLQRLRAIRQYPYTVHVLGRDLSYEEVTEIFVRVNSLGAKLRSSDLALAQITARWRGALSEFEAFERECLEEDFPLPQGIFVRGIMVHATGQSRFKTVGSLSLEDMKAGWTEAKRGIGFAIHFLRHNAGIESPALLSSPYIVLGLGYLAQCMDYNLSAADEKALRFWVQVANGRGRYSRGSSETLLDQDLATIRAEKGIPALTDSVRQAFGRLHFDLEELEGRNQRASVFRLMFLTLKAQQAKDWQSGIAISVGSFGTEHKLQFHHIFPRALLKDDYKRKDVNDIANLAFISGRTNRSISAKNPRDYLEKIVKSRGEEALIAQCVPLDRALWDVKRYPDFLAERRKLLLQRINEFIGPQ